MPGRVPALLLPVVAALAALVLAGCSGSDEPATAKAAASATTSPADAVAASFKDYTAAVNAKNGDQSADLMSASSRTYYDHLRTLALDADKATLQKQPLIDQITVLSFRQELPVSVLRTASPHDLVSKAVQVGLISQNDAAGVSLQKITVTGSSATADLVQQDPDSTTPVTFPVTFQLEDQRWRFDITSLLGPAQDQMTLAAKTNHLTGTALVEKVAEARTSTVAQAQALWKPLGR